MHAWGGTVGRGGVRHGVLPLITNPFRCAEGGGFRGGGQTYRSVTLLSYSCFVSHFQIDGSSGAPPLSRYDGSYK